MKFAPIIRIGQVPESKRQRGDLSVNVMRKTGRGLFKLKENRSLDMTFGDFVNIYLNDIKPRIKYNTWLTKKHIVDKKILPYFTDRKLQEIKTADIRQWQNTIMNHRDANGKGYSQVYLRQSTIK